VGGSAKSVTIAHDVGGPQCNHELTAPVTDAPAKQLLSRLQLPLNRLAVAT
jgi:hypothetical protein